MPSAFGIVRSGKARVQAIASPLDSENFDKAGALFGGALQMALGWQSRGPKFYMVALISSILAVFISLPSLCVTIAPGAALINLAVQNRMPCQSVRFALKSARSD